MTTKKIILKLNRDIHYHQKSSSYYLQIHEKPALSLFFTGGSITVIELDDAGVIDSE
jgi:hypothetical protein